MQGVADRARKLIETKVIRHVRTEAGVRRYKQPIGSIILNDSLLVGIREIEGDLQKQGAVKIAGDNGKQYLITKKHNGYFVFESGKRGGAVLSATNEMEAYAQLAQMVQREAGIDTRGPGGLPGAGGKREGWSANQIEAATSEVYSWGNSATDDGNQRLADEMWDAAGRADNQQGARGHGDLRVLRHELEQLKKRDDLNLDGANPGGGTWRDLIDGAIGQVVSEGKLRKRYDEAAEKQYADQVLAEQQASSNVPKPVKVADIGTGQWVRKVNQDDTRGPWFKVTSVASQSRTGRSKMITGRDQDGKLVRHTQQGPRDRYESVDDPKTAAMAPGEADAHQAAAEREARVPDQVVKPVHRLRKGDYTTLTGTVDGKPLTTTTGYVADDYVGKDDYTTPARRKNPVYKVEMSDDKAGKVNRRTVVVPKGTVSGPAEEPKPAPDVAGFEHVPPGELQDEHLPDRPGGYNFIPQKTDYPGYDKFIGLNGRTFYLDRDETGTDIYDANDKLLAAVGPGAAATLDKLQELSTPKQVRSHVAEYESEYDGYKKFVGANDEVFYVAKEGRETAVYDANDNLIFRTSGERTALDILNERAMEGAPKSRGAEPVAETPKETPAEPAVLTRLKSKFDGWKRFKLPDGRVVDTGQATEDDNRWYATGKGGWDDIIADGDSEDEMMTKLRAIASPSDTPVSFSPGNTDVAPKVNVPNQAQITQAEANRPVTDELNRLAEAIAAHRQSGNNTELINGLNDLRRRVLTGKVTREEAVRWLRGRQDSRKHQRERQDLTDAADRLAGVSAQPSPIAGMSREEYDRTIARANKNPGLRASVLGKPDDSATLTERALAKDVSPVVPQDRASGKPSRIAPMTQVMAATDIHNMANDFEPASTPYVHARNIARALEENKISTEEASRVLNIRARELDDEHGSAAEQFRQAATRIMNYDWRTRDEIAEDARAKRAQALREARQDIGQINQQNRRVLSAHAEAKFTQLSKLDASPGTATRNGKPLKDADRKLLNMNEDSNGVPNRLKRPANINTLNRYNSINDQDAMQAVLNRATNNYLEGMTHAAAWKEALDAADTFAGDQYGRGYSQRLGDGSYQSFLPGDVHDSPEVRRSLGVFATSQEAVGTANRTYNQERWAKLRDLPVSGAPDPRPSVPNAPTATTAGGNSREARIAEGIANAVSGSEALDAMTIEARIANLAPWFAEGPNFNRAVSEGVMYGGRKHAKGLDGDLDITEAEVAAGLRPREDIGKKRNAGFEPSAQIAPLAAPSSSKQMNATESMATFRSLDKASATRLAQEDPARFVEAMAEGGFGSESRRQEKDRVQATLATETNAKARADLNRISTATQKRMRENYELLRRAAAAIRETDTHSAVQSLLYSIRLRNQGMMGADARKMMAIYNTLKREQGL